METIAQSLSGTARPLVAAFGTLAMKPGRLATADQAYDPESVGATRAKAEDTMRELAARGIRTPVIRLPPIVHGAGDRSGFAPRLIQIAAEETRSRGMSVMVGTDGPPSTASMLLGYSG
jgi:hypothetical protein